MTYVYNIARDSYIPIRNGQVLHDCEITTFLTLDISEFIVDYMSSCEPNVINYMCLQKCSQLTTMRRCESSLSTLRNNLLEVGLNSIMHASSSPSRTTTDMMHHQNHQLTHASPSSCSTFTNNVEGTISKSNNITNKASKGLKKTKQNVNKTKKISFQQVHFRLTGQDDQMLKTEFHDSSETTSKP